MQRQGAEQRLRELGVRVPVEIVRDAVRRLDGGASNYSLYRRGRGVEVAKGTAEKLRRLWAGGKLEFVRDAEVYRHKLNEELEWVSGEEGRLQLDLLDRLDRLDRGEVAEDLTEKAERFQATLKGLLDDIYKLVPQWNVTSLELGHVPADRVLSLLNERDGLWEAWRLNEANKRWWRWPGLERYVALHETVFLCRYYQAAPFGLLEIVAELEADHLVNGKELARDLVRYILRYEIWRGDEYLEAFKRAIQGKRRVWQLWKRQMEEVVRALIESGNVHGEQAEARKEAQAEELGTPG